MKKVMICAMAIIGMIMSFVVPKTSIAEMSGEIAETVYEIVAEVEED